MREKTKEQKRCLVWAGQRLLSWERQAIGELQFCRRDRPAVATAAHCAAHLRVLAFPSLPCSLHIRPPAGGSAWRAGSVDNLGVYGSRRPQSGAGYKAVTSRLHPCLPDPSTAAVAASPAAGPEHERWSMLRAGSRTR